MIFYKSCVIYKYFCNSDTLSSLFSPEHYRITWQLSVWTMELDRPERMLALLLTGFVFLGKLPTLPK